MLIFNRYITGIYQFLYLPAGASACFGPVKKRIGCPAVAGLVWKPCYFPVQYFRPVADTLVFEYVSGDRYFPKIIFYKAPPKIKIVAYFL